MINPPPSQELAANRHPRLDHYRKGQHAVSRTRDARTQQPRQVSRTSNRGHRRAPSWDRRDKVPLLGTPMSGRQQTSRTDSPPPRGGNIKGRRIYTRAGTDAPPGNMKRDRSSSPDRKRNTGTSRHRSEVRPPAGAPAPIQARAGGADSPPQELAVGEKIHLKSKRAGCLQQDPPAQRLGRCDRPC